MTDLARVAAAGGAARVELSRGMGAHHSGLHVTTSHSQPVLAACRYLAPTVGAEPGARHGE
jgi:hypothetical protein